MEREHLPDGLAIDTGGYRSSLVELTRDYLVLGVIRGAASLGIEVSQAEVRAALFDPPPGESGDERLQLLLRQKRAEQQPV